MILLIRLFLVLAGVIAAVWLFSRLCRSPKFVSAVNTLGDSEPAEAAGNLKAAKRNVKQTIDLASREIERKKTELKVLKRSKT